MNRYILVVEDDQDLAEAVRDTLTGEAYEVVVARDGLEALEHLATSPPPALILLDWMMPRCDGVTFRERQRADPSIAEIPVVIFSAAGGALDRELAAETATLMRKPASLEELLRVAARYCRAADIQAEIAVTDSPQ